MKYWQNEETGMCCAVAKQPSPRHIEVSKEFYDLHESGLTPRAVDSGDSPIKMGLLTPEEDAAIKADNQPAHSA